MNFGICQDSSCAIREVQWEFLTKNASILRIKIGPQISQALSALLELWVGTSYQQHILQNQIKIRNPGFSSGVTWTG